MRVNICGIMHEVVQVPTTLGNEGSQGLITFGKAEIQVNKDLTDDCLKETLCHEMLHGMLTHIGRTDLSDDEVFVQSLSNAIYQGFEIKCWQSVEKNTNDTK